MYFVYVLKNPSGELYYGYTNNPERRISEHIKESNWKVIYYEAYLSEKDARDRERKLKHYGQSRTHLKMRIKNSFNNLHL